MRALRTLVLPLSAAIFTAIGGPAPCAAEGNQAPADDGSPSEHWAYQPVERPAVPEVSDDGWVRTPVDAFLLSKLQDAGLEPAPPASKTEWLRRAYYDLIGLPPSPEEVQAFLADDSPDAFETVIDRLLDSPHYGERWGRHWLDLVRYAETNSYERDNPKPFVWRYRDYVIRSLNEDKPYDQFLREQLAGDELDEVTPESIIATGYYRLGVWNDEPADPKQALYDDLDDILSTTGQVFLGMTIGCARCHDHKLDPIPQKDYYRMLAFFRNVRRYGVRAHETVVDASVRVIATEEERRRHERLVQEHERELEETERKLKEIEQLVWDDLSGIEKDEFKTEAARIPILKKRVPQLLSQKQFDRYVDLTKKRDRLRENDPPGLKRALCVKEHGPEAPTTHVLNRGNPHAEGEVVQPAFPAVLNPPEPDIRKPPGPDPQSTGRRRALAEWIASEENPLTARVMVNRIWQYHFGRGIVRSPNDFGTHGQAPTHPKLLDWLAAEFMDRGWRLKPMHKLIMMSSAYRMSSRSSPEGREQDPENDLFWRFDMRRLEAEEIRDSILAVNGSLNRTEMFGPSIYTKIPEAVLAGQSRPGQGWGLSPPRERARRSIYIHVKRSLIPPLLARFDSADTDNSCPVRFETTQPTQALGMLNSKFVNEQAAVFAEDLQGRAHDPAEQVKLALWRVLQRPPRDEEIQRGVDLIRSLRETHGASREKALEYFCLTALNMNEFFYLD